MRKRPSYLRLVAAPTSPAAVFEDLLRQFRALEAARPTRPKFDASKLPPRVFATEGEELAWAIVATERLQKWRDDLDARFGAFDAYAAEFNRVINRDD